MKDIRETWTIEATAGTVGVSEATFRYAVIPRNKARTEAEAIAYVRGEDWFYSGGRFYRSRTDLYARTTFAFAEDVDSEGEGAPGSVSPPDFSSRHEAEEFARELEAR